jgi:hypothetical protein
MQPSTQEGRHGSPNGDRSLESRMIRKYPVRLCVQERLLCPAGVSPVGVTIGSPVAGWQAGGKPNDLKPIDNPILGMGASRRAVTTVNAWWPRKGEVPEAEPATVRAKAAGVVENRLTRRVTPAGWLATARRQGHSEQLEKPSSSRGEIRGSWVGRITGDPGKSADDERVADGSAVATKRSNARGAKGPCCS